MSNGSYTCFVFPTTVFNKYRDEILDCLAGDDGLFRDARVVRKNMAKPAVSGIRYPFGFDWWDDSGKVSISNDCVPSGGDAVAERLMGGLRSWCKDADDSFVFFQDWGGCFDYPAGNAYGSRDFYVTGDVGGPIIRVRQDGNPLAESMAEAVSYRTLERLFDKVCKESKGVPLRREEYDLSGPQAKVNFTYGQNAVHVIATSAIVPLAVVERGDQAIKDFLYDNSQLWDSDSEQEVSVHLGSTMGSNSYSIGDIEDGC